MGETVLVARSSGIRAIGRTRLRPHRIVRLSFHPEAEPKWLLGWFVTNMASNKVREWKPSVRHSL